MLHSMKRIFFVIICVILGLLFVTLTTFHWRYTSIDTDTMTSSLGVSITNDTQGRTDSQRTETTTMKSITVAHKSRNSSVDGPCHFNGPKLSSKPLSLTFLASYPGSGNTWVRFLLQRATGIGTASVYCDDELRRHGFPFECSNSKWRHLLVVKTHKTVNRDHFHKAILIIRNPFNAILSHFNFKYTQKDRHVAVASEGKFKSVWPRWVPKVAQIWKNQVTFYTQRFNGSVLPVVYEHLKANLGKELSRMVTYLGKTIPKASMNCILKEEEGQHHRGNATTTIPRNLYTAPMRKLVNSKIDEVASIVHSKYGIDLSFYKRP